jgi:hypothetical protein
LPESHSGGSIGAAHTDHAADRQTIGLEGAIMFYFWCLNCKAWIEYPKCPFETDGIPHNVGQKTSLAHAPDGLRKKLIQTIEPTHTYNRKPEKNPVPPPSVANYQRHTAFGFEVKLTGREETVSNLNFWFRFDGELYEALGSQKLGKHVTVDGLCKGEHGEAKQHIRHEFAARHILASAGYTVT